MSIRKNTNPRPLDLPPEMQDLLLRNGMRGYLAGSSEGFALIVQGHDSPLLTYPIGEKQLRALTDWGTNSANKRCYNTLRASWPPTSTCRKTSYMPGTPTDGSPWDCTATVPVPESMGVWECPCVLSIRSATAFSAGHPGNKGASTCGASAETSTIPVRLSCQTALTDA